MSRFEVKYKDRNGNVGKGTIGYDKPLRTYFLQLGQGSTFWIGTFLEEYPSLDGIITAAQAHGYTVKQPDSTAMIKMLEEASQKPRPSLGERLNLVR